MSDSFHRTVRDDQLELVSPEIQSSEEHITVKKYGAIEEARNELSLAGDDYRKDLPIEEYADVEGASVSNKESGEMNTRNDAEDEYNEKLRSYWLEKEESEEDDDSTNSEGAFAPPKKRTRFVKRKPISKYKVFHGVKRKRRARKGPAYEALRKAVRARPWTSRIRLMKLTKMNILKIKEKKVKFEEALQLFKMLISDFEEEYDMETDSD